jgi:hypothetical protein
MTYPAIITKKLETGQILATLTNTTQQGLRYQFVSESGAVGLGQHLKALGCYAYSLHLETQGSEWVTAPLDSFSYVHLLVPTRAKTYKIRTPLSPAENTQNSAI